MKMNAQEIKALTGAPTRIHGENILYTQLEGRKWFYGGHEAQCAGYDRRKGWVHFTATWSAGSGVVGHRRVGLPLKVALETQDGIIDPHKAIILY